MNALGAVAGVDLNPYAIAIARFRLLLEAWRICDVKHLRGAPNFKVNLAVGDSLLHGPPPGVSMTEAALRMRMEAANNTYGVERIEDLARILAPKYEVVVGNPPYITVKDNKLSGTYRTDFRSCHGKYSLAVPFMERFFDLAVEGDGTLQQPSGYVGKITSNSFMKRPFAKKLIENYIPRWDLTHIVDSAGAYIPGHNREGTPTVILFGKNQSPRSGTIRTLLGIRSEPKTPDDPAHGLVWQAIIRQIDQPGSESEWLTVADTPREKFHRFPWLIGGGGVADVKELLDGGGETTLGKCADELRGKPNIGITSFTLEDDMYIQPGAALMRQGISTQSRAPMVDGDNIRHWAVADSDEVVLPYDERFQVIDFDANLPEFRFLWLGRTTLANSKMFGKQTKVEAGLRWYEFGRLTAHKLRQPTTITFSDVSTHNNFALNCRRRVFNRHAPLVILHAGVSEQNHLELLGILNSSAACFWLKQVCFPKDGSAREWHERFEFAATLIANLPIPARQPSQLPTALVKYSDALQSLSPAATMATWTGHEPDAVNDLRDSLAAARDLSASHRRKLIAWQEELDWQVYAAYGLVDPADGVSLPEGAAMDAVYDFGLALGERAFEIALARRVAAGETQTTWFERHGSTPITDPPPHWPAAYRELVERRLRRIESDPNVRLIEQPEYKRRWNTEPWDAQQTRALRDWLLRRLETAFHGGERLLDPVPADANPALRAHHAARAVPPAVRAAFPAAREPRLATTRQLADALTHDPAFLAVAALYRGGREDFDLPRLVRELVEEESVPFLPAQRYKDPGLRKRAQWERTWDLQREEDRIDALPADAAVPRPPRPVNIPVPPKYGSGDFKRTTYWRLRGKLDVPKERWLLYPGAERPADAGCPVIAWAGWDHREQAQALAAHYTERKDQDGWPPERLAPLLAGLRDLVPWLKQWHNEIDPTYGLRLGDFYEGFVRDETHALGLSEAEVEAVRMGTGAAG